MAVLVSSRGERGGVPHAAASYNNPCFCQQCCPMFCLCSNAHQTNSHNINPVLPSVLFHNVFAGKYTVGLGQQAMTFCGDREDVVSMAATAVLRLLENSGVKLTDIGR